MSTSTKLMYMHSTDSLVQWMMEMFWNKLPSYVDSDKFQAHLKDVIENVKAEEPSTPQDFVAEVLLECGFTNYDGFGSKGAETFANWISGMSGDMDPLWCSKCMSLAFHELKNGMCEDCDKK